MSTLDNSEKIRTYLLAGNGFDIALRLKTKYNDFFMVVGLIIGLDVYQHFCRDKFDVSDVKQGKISVTDKVKEWFQNLDEDNIFTYSGCYKTEHIDKEYYKEITEFALNYYISPNFNIDDFKKDLTSPFYFDFMEKIFPNFCPYFKAESSNYYDYCKYAWLFEKADSDVDAKYLSDYDVQKLNRYMHLYRFIQILHVFVNESMYQNWMDLESFIELLVTGNAYLESKFKITQERKYLHNQHSMALAYSSGLEKFCLMFEKYISIINKGIPKKYDVNDIIEPYKKSFQKRNTDEDVSLLDLSKIDAIFSYNYTDTFAKLFPQLSKNDHIYYINGKVSGDFNSERKESKIVFGYTRNNRNIDVSPKCLIFEKDKQRFLKNIKMHPYDQIFNQGKFNIVIFGHSCSPADGDVFRSILNSPKLNKAVICCYDKDSMTSAYENLVKMLDECPSSDTTINDLIINKKVLFCLKDKKDKKDS